IWAAIADSRAGSSRSRSSSPPLIPLAVAAATSSALAFSTMSEDRLSRRAIARRVPSIADSGAAAIAGADACAARTASATDRTASSVMITHRSRGRPGTRRHQPTPMASLAGAQRVCNHSGTRRVLWRTDREGGWLADFDEFYAAHYGSLTTQLYAYLGDRQEAQDVVQEAFCRAYARWSSVRDYDDPVAWVRRVAWNLATSHVRRL